LIGNQWILDLCNGFVKEGCIPEDWKSSVVLPIYKQKGDPMECGFYRETILFDTISIVRQMQEKFRAKGKKLCFVFVDLEKAFDRVPREVKMGVEEWLVLVVMSVYPGAKTVVRTVYGNSNGFEVKVDMHQGSALNPCYL